MQATSSNGGELGVTRETLLLRLLDELSAARDLTGESILPIPVAALVILNHCSESKTERQSRWSQCRVSCGPC
jgi:hypothetical protein